MKHDIRSMLDDYVLAAQCPVLSPQQRDAFQMYYDILLDWNTRMNLTAITEPRAVCEKHFIDSLLLQQCIPKSNPLAIVDVGSGAGFPGIPLAIVFPEHHFTLLDALNKRVTFLQHLITALNLGNVTAVHGRSEDLARQSAHRDRYDYGVARAVARLPLLLEYVMPFIKPQGTLIASKGSDATNELKESNAAMHQLVTTLDHVVATKLPSGDERNLMIFRKQAVTPSAFPRRPGLAKKNPL